MNRQLLLVAFSACALAACRHTPTPAHAPPNILLIVIDTLRADRLGGSNHAQRLTPFLDSVAEHATVFHTAYAQSSWTNPSVASLITSRYPSQHGVTTPQAVLSPSELTLAEALRQHGFATAGISANGLIGKQAGFDQGYDHFLAMWSEPTVAPPRAAAVTNEALRWLDAREQAAARPDTSPAKERQPVFLYLHYMEAHFPYAPHPDALAKVFAGRQAPDVDDVNDEIPEAFLWGARADTVAEISEIYDAAVLSLDADLRTLFAELVRRHFLDNAVVVITADHGEEFFDHGGLGHGHALFNELIRVPLVIASPQQTAHLDIETPVALVDVAPTLLDAIGADKPPSFEGRSLQSLVGHGDQGWASAALRRWGSGSRDTRSVYSELRPWNDATRNKAHERAVVDGTRKLIAGGEQRAFFDLAADPSEQHPAALDDQQRTALGALLNTFAQQVTGRPTPAATQVLDDATRERMRGLGYDTHAEP
ncbi:MAG: sulfatase [bacterium]